MVLRDRKGRDDMAEEIELWNTIITREQFGDRYDGLLIEQYKLYVESAEKVSDRRNLANTFFLSVHTLLLGILGFFIEKKSELADKWLISAFLVALLAFCAAWWLIVRSYRQLNSGKFKVVGELEKRLPASPYWSAEWKVLGEGKDIKKYFPLTHVENWTPVIFALLYAILAALFWTT
jgi:hypothetical protein